MDLGDQAIFQIQPQQQCQGMLVYLLNNDAIRHMHCAMWPAMPGLLLQVKNPLARSQSAPEQPARAPRQLPPIPRFDGSKPPLPGSTAAAAAAPAAASATVAKPTAAVAAAVVRQQVVLGDAAEAAAGDEDEDETVPHVMNKLALKIAKGRQSLAPGKVRMGCGASNASLEVVSILAAPPHAGMHARCAPSATAFSLHNSIF